MIIERITLDNIRSYRQHAPIELSTGVTLFEGDIGSGKSTILTAIEFALFGLGDISGTYLLRHGAKTGSVILEFSVNSKHYKVFRSLKCRGKSVTQKEGYIVEDGQRTDYSVTEMKTKILEILSFNEIPRPRTSSLIYRYAIFTPQEEMKKVLFQPVELRLETLRRAFRVEDYNTIADNTSIILKWIDREAEILKRQTEDINEKRTSLKEEKEKIEKFKKELKTLQASLESLTAEKEEIVKKIEKFQDQKEAVIKLQAELPHLQENIRQKNQLIGETTEAIKKLKKQLKEIEDAEQLLLTISPKYEELLSFKQEIESLESSIEKIRDLNKEKEKLQIAIQKEKKALEKQIQSAQNTVEKTLEWLTENRSEILEIPPLENQGTALQKQVEMLPSISEELDGLKQEKSATENEIKTTKKLHKQVEAEHNDLQEIGIGAPCPKCKQKLTQQHYEKIQKDYLEKLKEFETKISELEDKKDNLNKEIRNLGEKKKSLEESVDELGKIQQKLAGLRKQKDIVKEKEEEHKKNQLFVDDLQQKLAEKKYAEIERKQMSNIEEHLKELSPVQTEYDEIKKRIKDFDNEQIEKNYHTNNEKISKKNEIESDISKNQEKAASLKKQLEKQTEEFENKQKDYASQKVILDVIAELETEKKSLDKQVEEERGAVIAKGKDVEKSEEEAERISGEITAREEQLLKFDELKQYELWLSEYFILAVKQIESHMLTNINSEFNSLFQKWITHLLEAGDIVVSVDENFSPQIVQDGYDVDVKSLSGGEKTSVALAYRLALNVMVKKVCDAMQSNLLILDEPTDGFGREQLSRLRDILNDLNCEQVIIVSHENELEGFVDHIFRVTKDSGESKILTA